MPDSMFAGSREADRQRPEFRMVDEHFTDDANGHTPFLSVRGEALLEVEPEIATVSVTLVARDSSPDEVLTRLRERAQRLSSVIDHFHDALDKVETSAVRVIPEFKDSKPSERILGYAGELRTTVTVSDFTHLGDLVVQTARGDMVAVSGPWWSLRSDSPVFRRCRVLAVEDAVCRAREYAEALGSELTGLLELADAGLSFVGPHDPKSHTNATTSSSSTSPVREDLSLEPAMQTVHAQVEARFTMSAPDLTPKGQHSVRASSSSTAPNSSAAAPAKA